MSVSQHDERSRCARQDSRVSQSTAPRDLTLQDLYRISCFQSFLTSYDIQLFKLNEIIKSRGVRAFAA